jgi:hypothetical protein
MPQVTNAREQPSRKSCKTGRKATVNASPFRSRHERKLLALLKAIFLTFLAFEKDSENQRNQTGDFLWGWGREKGGTPFFQTHIPVFRGNTLIKESEWRFNVVLGSREAVATGILCILWWSSEFLCRTEQPLTSQKVHLLQAVKYLVPSGNC